MDLKNQNITITGSKGSLSLRYEKVISINHLDNELLVSRSGDEKFQKALHGTTRQLIQNMVEGVYGFSKELELIGVGYQASVQGNRLKLQLGFSHDIFLTFHLQLTLVRKEHQLKLKVLISNL